MLLTRKSSQRPPSHSPIKILALYLKVILYVEKEVVCFKNPEEKEHYGISLVPAVHTRGLVLMDIYREGPSKPS
jgi:hypothetical protein